MLKNKHRNESEVSRAKCNVDACHGDSEHYDRNHLNNH